MERPEATPLQLKALKNEDKARKEYHKFCELYRFHYEQNNSQTREYYLQKFAKLMDRAGKKYRLILFISGTTSIPPAADEQEDDSLKELIPSFLFGEEEDESKNELISQIEEVTTTRVQSISSTVDQETYDSTDSPSFHFEEIVKSAMNDFGNDRLKKQMKLGECFNIILNSSHNIFDRGKEKLQVNSTLGFSFLEGSKFSGRFFKENFQELINNNGYLPNWLFPASTVGIVAHSRFANPARSLNVAVYFHLYFASTCSIFDPGKRIDEIVINHGYRFNLLFMDSSAIVLIENRDNGDGYNLFVKMLQWDRMYFKNKGVSSHQLASEKSFYPCFDFSGGVFDPGRHNFPVNEGFMTLLLGISDREGIFRLNGSSKRMRITKGCLYGVGGEFIFQLQLGKASYNLISNENVFLMVAAACWIFDRGKMVDLIIWNSYFATCVSKFECDFCGCLKWGYSQVLVAHLALIYRNQLKVLKLLLMNSHVWVFVVTEDYSDSGKMFMKVSRTSSTRLFDPGPGAVREYSFGVHLQFEFLNVVVLQLTSLRVPRIQSTSFIFLVIIVLQGVSDLQRLDLFHRLLVSVNHGLWFGRVVRAYYTPAWELSLQMTKVLSSEFVNVFVRIVDNQGLLLVIQILDVVMLVDYLRWKFKSPASGNLEGLAIREEEKKVSYVELLMGIMDRREGVDVLHILLKGITILAVYFCFLISEACESFSVAVGYSNLTGVTECDARKVIHVDVAVQFSILSCDKMKRMSNVSYKNEVCNQLASTFMRLPSRHLAATSGLFSMEIGIEVIKYPSWVVSPTFVYFQACCGQFLWVFRGLNYFGRILGIRQSESVVLMITLKESSYFMKIILSASLTTRAKFYFSKTGSVLHLLILTFEVCGGTMMQREVITTLLYPSGSCLNTVYHCQHLKCRYNLIWGSWYEPKRSNYSTKLFSRAKRTQVLPVVTQILKELVWLEYLRWKFRLDSTDLWGIGEIRGTMWPSSELTATPGYMGLNRLLFDRGKVPEPFSCNSHSRSFGTTPAYNYTEVNGYGENYMITRSDVIVWSLRRCFMTVEHRHKNSALVGLVCCWAYKLEEILAVVVVQIEDAYLVFEGNAMSAYQTGSGDAYGLVCCWAYKLEILFKWQVSYLQGKNDLIAGYSHFETAPLPFCEEGGDVKEPCCC